MDYLNIRKSFFAFLLVLFVSSYSAKANASTSDEEAAALLKWKASSGNENNSFLTSWNLQPTNAKNSSNPCTWAGVSCIDGSVNRLKLTNSSVKGTLEDFPFSSLPNLEYLDLSLNEISGSIPPVIGPIPPEIGNLKALESLSLSENNLTGSIPKSLGSTTNLALLSLDRNQFSGSIPASLGNLSKLEILELHDNKLSDAIPEELGQIPELCEQQLAYWSNPKMPEKLLKLN
nr:probable leucine-rich repeat receptor-like protein kinase At1g35710 [Coffea arabica]